MREFTRRSGGKSAASEKQTNTKTETEEVNCNSTLTTKQTAAAAAATSNLISALCIIAPASSRQVESESAALRCAASYRS